ncbi:MAG: PfkB family carbohydrate kinase [Actinomycetota bacterium]
MTPDVVGLGLACADHLGRVVAPAEFDKLTLMADFDQQGGGPVATALVALARLGCRTGCIAAIGRDATGDFIVEDFQLHGVETAGLRRMDGSSPSSMILVSLETGKRAIHFYPGGTFDFSLEEKDRELIRSARFLHLDGWYPTAAQQAAELAREVGVGVILDGTIARPGMEQLIPLTRALIADAEFPSSVTGRANVEDAAAELLGMGPEIVVVTLGEAGLLAMNGNETLRLPAYDVEVVDTTGAGDVFHGAFIYGLLQEWPLERVCRFASATAALKCTRLGGRQGIPTLDDVKAFLEERGEG